MVKPSMAFPNHVDTWWAWRPVRLSVFGTGLGEPDPDGKFFVETKQWAWRRRLKRIRGLHLAGTVYMELPDPKVS